MVLESESTGRNVLRVILEYKSATQQVSNSSTSAWLLLIDPENYCKFILLILIAKSPFGARGLKMRGAEAPRLNKNYAHEKISFMKLLLLPAYRQRLSPLNLHPALLSFDQPLLQNVHRAHPHRCG